MGKPKAPNQTDQVREAIHGLEKVVLHFLHPWTTAPDDARGYTSIYDDGKPRRRLSMRADEGQCDQTAAKSNVRDARVASLIQGRMYQIGQFLMTEFDRRDRAMAAQLGGEARFSTIANKKFDIVHNGTFEYDGRKARSVQVTERLMCTGHYMTSEWRTATHMREAYRDYFSRLHLQRRKSDDVCDALTLALEFAVRKYEERVKEIAREQRGVKNLLTRKRHEWWPRATRVLHERGATIRVLGIDVGTKNFAACHIELYNAYWTPRSGGTETKEDKGDGNGDGDGDDDDNGEELRPVFRILHWGLFNLHDPELLALPDEVSPTNAVAFDAAVGVTTMQEQVIYRAPPTADPMTWAVAPPSLAIEMANEEHRMRELIGCPAPPEAPVVMPKRPRRKPAPKRKREEGEEEEEKKKPTPKRARKAPAKGKRKRAASETVKKTPPAKRQRKTPAAAPAGGVVDYHGGVPRLLADDEPREVPRVPRGHDIPALPVRPPAVVDLTERDDANERACVACIARQRAHLCGHMPPPRIRYRTRTPAAQQRLAEIFRDHLYGNSPSPDQSANDAARDQERERFRQTMLNGTAVPDVAHDVSLPSDHSESVDDNPVGYEMANRVASPDGFTPAGREQTIAFLRDNPPLRHQRPGDPLRREDDRQWREDMRAMADLDHSLRQTHAEYQQFLRSSSSLVYPPPPTEPEPSLVSDDPSDPRLCLICLDRAYATVAVPCGHRLGCLTCMSKGAVKACMLCREPLKLILRVRE